MGLAQCRQVTGLLHRGSDLDRHRELVLGARFGIGSCANRTEAEAGESLDAGVAATRAGRERPQDLLRSAQLTAPRMRGGEAPQRLEPGWITLGGAARFRAAGERWSREIGLSEGAVPRGQKPRGSSSRESLLGLARPAELVTEPTCLLEVVAENLVELE